MQILKSTTLESLPSKSWKNYKLITNNIYNFLTGPKSKTKRYKTIILVLGFFLILMISVNIILVGKIIQKKNTVDILEFLAAPVLAQEINPLFYCPCCGRPLDKENICCGLARERVDYIDSLVQQALSKDEVILAYVKKYGSNSFVDKGIQKQFREKLVEQAPADRPIISFISDFYDFGDVSQSRGVATAFFEFKNDGNEDLIISRLETSCGCTSASIIYKGEEGPVFSMPGHGRQNPQSWSVSIAPGDTVQVKIYYDPNVHKDFRGAAIREIYIYSNDPINFQKKVRIELNQVD